MIRDNKTLKFGVATFFLLSLADFMITWKLVAAANTEVDEVNPLASWVLNQFGWAGLAAYKLTLVSFIAALVVVIALRRRQVGGAVIMFGCGAQAAVIVTSLFLLVGGAEAQSRPVAELNNDSTNCASGFLPLGGFALLTDERVQKELTLSTDTINHIQAINEKRRELRQRIRTENMVEIQELVHQQYEQEHLLGTSLNSQQTKRLQEICWQVRGPLALFDGDVIALLELTDEQLQSLLELRETGQWQNVSLRNDVNAGSSSDQRLLPIGDQLLNVLSATQRRRWQSMQGERFIFDVEAASSNSISVPAGE